MVSKYSYCVLRADNSQGNPHILCFVTQQQFLWGANPDDVHRVGDFEKRHMAGVLHYMLKNEMSRTPFFRYPSTGFPADEKVKEVNK